MFEEADMAKNKEIEHDGIVRKVTEDGIEVVIESLSACACCHAKSVCGMADAEQKVITAKQSLSPVVPGDKVTVYASLNHAFFSVILAYVIPVFIIIAFICMLLHFGAGETSAAIGALGGIIVYFILLYLNRSRIGSKIRFTVEKRA